jgi:hypothetical protein
MNIECFYPNSDGSALLMTTRKLEESARLKVVRHLHLMKETYASNFPWVCPWIWGGLHAELALDW